MKLRQQRDWQDKLLGSDPTISRSSKLLLRNNFSRNTKLRNENCTPHDSKHNITSKCVKKIRNEEKNIQFFCSTVRARGDDSFFGRQNLFYLNFWFKPPPAAAPPSSSEQVTHRAVILFSAVSFYLVFWKIKQKCAYKSWPGRKPKTSTGFLGGVPRREQ